MPPDAPGTLVAPQPVPPARQYSFTDQQVNNPGGQPPGDKLDGEYDRTNQTISDTIAWAATSLNTDGSLKPHVVGESQLVPGLLDDIGIEAVALLQPLVEQTGNYVIEALNAVLASNAGATLSGRHATQAGNFADEARKIADTLQAAARDAEDDARSTSSDADRAENAANHADGSEAVAQAYADVGMAWAEHMPDTIPPNILAVQNVTGDHWSARWWANKALENISQHTPLDGGTLTGPLYWTATGGTVSRSAQDRSADEVNVLDFAGADPTGVLDSTAAFQAALATGKAVWVPWGRYRIAGRLLVAGISQRFRGVGRGSVLVIDTSLDPTVTDGVVVVTGALFPEVSGLTFEFVQPNDLVKTATVASAAGSNTITVNSVTGIVIGMSVVDRTARPNAIPSTAYYTAAAPTTVTNIAGNVLTLSANIIAPGVANGDTLQFASSRSQFKTIAAGATTTPGGTGVQYPWAINVLASARIHDILVLNGWNGVYVRGSAFQISKLDVGAYNIGLDIDQCYNFPSLKDYRFYMFGKSVTGGPTDALDNVYNDGVTISANLGECDGLAVDTFQTWRGHLNLTTAWTWGSFTSLMLDGDNTNLSILGTNAAGWTQIANGYSTNGANTHGPSIQINANQQVKFVNFDLISSSNSASGFVVLGGTVSFDNGYIWNGTQTSASMIEVFNQGTLRIANTDLDASVGRTDLYINTSGNPQVDLENVRFPTAGGPGATALNGGVRSLSNVQWNGWKLVAGNNLLNNGNNFLAPLDNTSMQAGGLAFAALGASAHFNTGYGAFALDNIQDAAHDNTVFGSQCGSHITTGTYNTFIGSVIGWTNSVTGVGNCVIGANAGYSLSSGSSNILIGSYVDQAGLTTGSGNILIGSNLSPATSGTSNTMNLGGIIYTTGLNNSATALTTMWGKFALHTLRNSPGYANDAAAAAGGVGVEEVYRNGSQLMLRVA